MSPVRHPIGQLVAHVVDGFPARGSRGRPEGVVGVGMSISSPVVQKALHGHDDEPLTPLPV